MKMPGFTAKASLHKNGEHFSRARLHDLESNDVIVPQLTCDCSTSLGGGKVLCYCCHLNFRTQIMTCYKEVAFIA